MLLWSRGDDVLGVRNDPYHYMAMPAAAWYNFAVIPAKAGIHPSLNVARFAL
jgi:hypothetical protein